MNAKEYLRQYEYAARRAYRLEKELEEEYLLIDSVKSLSDLDGLPHGSNISRPVEERAVRIVDKAAELYEARIEALELRQEIFETIMSIDKKDGLACDVLCERYVELKTWEKVCEAVSYTWHTVRIAWHRGLDLVEQQINTRNNKSI